MSYDKKNLTFVLVLLNLLNSVRINLYRGSYMSAHVLSNLLNELGKREKMLGKPLILSLFPNSFNKFDKT